MSGIIYKITCNVTGYIYIGSTNKTLRERMKLHKKDIKIWKKRGTHFTTSFICMINEDYTVECVCDNIDSDLVIAEFNEMKKYDNVTLVNLNKKYGTVDKRKKMREHAAERVECRCGSIVSRGNLPRHRYSIKHKDYIQLEKLCYTFEHTRLGSNQHGNVQANCNV